jgi:hypothetical protein
MVREAAAGQDVRRQDTTLIDTVRHGTTELAVIIRAGYVRPGITFLTPNDYSQQLGYMNRPAGYRIAAHIHNAVPRAVVFTREVLFVKSGRMRADFYTDERAYFEMLEDTEVIEVKQGPYAGDGDKTMLEPVARGRIRLRD